MQAKAYPSNLCKVMAEEYVAFAARAKEEGHDPMPEQASAALAALSAWDPYMADSTSTTMAQDYHGLRQSRQP